MPSLHVDEEPKVGTVTFDRPRQRRRLSLAALAVIVMAGAVYAVLAFFGSPGHQGAYAAANCSLSANGAGFKATIQLDAATSTTLGQDTAGDLLVDGNTCQNGVFGATPPTGSTGPINDIDFTQTKTPNPGLSIVLDQTQPGGIFPCSAAISGVISGYQLEIIGAANENVIVGTTGVNLNAQLPSGPPCVPLGTLNQAAGYLLVGGTGSGTVFDARGANVQNPTSPPGGPVVATFQAGNSTMETFRAGVTGSTLDFSQLTCPSGTCSIESNSTGATVGSPGVAKFTAALFSGSTAQSTIDYSANEADFTNVIGNGSIPTTFFAPPNTAATPYVLGGDVTFQAVATGTSSFTVMCVQSDNQIAAGAGTENIGVTGSNTTLTGGPGRDTFTVAGGSVVTAGGTTVVTGNNNIFQAGAGSDTFFDATGPNRVDFSKVDTTANPLRINTPNGTATAGTGGSVSYTFQTSSTNTSSAPFSTFLGATNGNTAFQTDSAGGLSFQGAGTGNSADFSAAGTSGNGVAVNLSGATQTTSSSVSVNPGQALVAPSRFDTLSNVSTVTGSSQGFNTFWGGAGTFAFNASGNSNLFNGNSGGTYNIGISGTTGNQVSAGAGTETFNVTGNSVILAGGSGTATFTDTGNNNVFMAGSGPASFFDSTGPNTVDFSNVGTSPNDQLAINAAGAPEQAVLSGNTVTLQNGQAEVGSGTLYTFLNSPGSNSASAFTTFNGAATGNSIFLGGAEFSGSTKPGNVTFSGGSGGGNSLSFPTVSTGMNIDLSPFPQAGSANTKVPATKADSISGITNVTGSPQGNNTFTAGAAAPAGSPPVTYNFTGNGNGNLFVGGGGADVFTSNGNGNTFQAGAGTGTFNDTGNGNTVDFSHLTPAPPVVVNVTGGVVGSLGTDQATATFPAPVGTTKYFFTGFGASNATFKGATGGTTFFAGSSGDTFMGQGLAADTLSFANASGTNLQICVTAAAGCTAGQAVLGSVDEPFVGIKTFNGLSASGSTTTFFADDSAGGYTFDGAAGTNITNTVDFSAATQSVQANLGTGQVTFTASLLPPNTDTVSDVSTVFGSANGGNTFTTGGSSQGSETFGDRGKGTLIHGPDSLDFSNVPTASQSPLSVDATGTGTSPFVATFGSITYNFSTGGSNFKTFDGAAGGFTTFLAGATSGYTFRGHGGSNSVDFSADALPITANLSGAPYGAAPNQVDSSRVAIGSGSCSLVCDTIMGITTVTGSLGGGNTFVAGGPGQTETFKGGSNNTVDFSNLATATVVNVAQPGLTLLSTPYGTATSGATTYDFTNFVASPTRFVGNTAGTTFFAGPTGDTFQGAGVASDTLNFANAPGAKLQVCVAGGSGPSGTCTAGQAVLGTVNEPFSGIKVFNGLSTLGSSTTFLADDHSGGFSFIGVAGTNTADFSAAAHAVQANLATGQVTFSATPPVSADSLTNVSTVFGSTGGGNTFTPGPPAQGSEIFGDRGVVATDTIDFSNVPTASGSPLSVNASGTGTSPFVATFGSVTYTFSTGGPNFTSFRGARGGFTSFLAGATGGYSFSGQGLSNSVDFSADPSSIVANLSGKAYGLPPNQVDGGRVAVGAGACPCDSISSITTVTGSSNGANTFVAGGPGAAETFKGGTNNTVDFSNLPAKVTVNVTGATVGSVSTDQATATFTAGGTTQYFFSGFGASNSTFVGAGGTQGTTFFAGSTTDTFMGQGLNTDTLSFANACTSLAPCAPGTSLQLCVASGSGPLGACSTGEAVLGNIDEFFSGIKIFNGLAVAGASSTFVADDTTGGYTFSGSALESNTADFSSALQGVTAKLNTGSVALGSGQPADTISSIATVFGSTNGRNTFIAGPTTSESFGDKGNSGGDKIDFSSLPGTTSANPLTINASVATSANGTPGFAATLGSLTDSFASGSQNFTAFTGSQGGSTNFIAPASTAGLSFTGQGPGNTADFSANPTAVTAEMPGSSASTSVQGQVTFVGVNGSDTLQGSIAKVVGSPVGKNTFDGALGGTTFVAQNSTAGNTVSYAGLPSGAVTFNLPGKLISGTSGIPDSYSFPAGAALTVEGSSSADTFQIGTSPVTIQGGGGSDIIDLSQVPVPASGSSPLTANLDGNPNPTTPAITGPTISGGVSFTTSTCATASPVPTDLCVGRVIGSPGNDTFVASANSLTATPPPSSPPTINGNGGSDILDLSQITAPKVGSPLPGAPATIDMPITSAKFNTNSGSPTCSSTPFPLGAVGAVCSSADRTKGITFSGISTVIGTQAGGDHFFAGSGKEDLHEIGAALGTLDYNVVVPAPTIGAHIGVTVNAADTADGFTGTVNSPITVGVMDTFAGFGTFIGSLQDDTFMQSGPSPTGGYIFNGGAGANSLDLSAAPSSTIQFTAPVGTEGCTGTLNNNGTATVGSTVIDTFTCMASVTALASEYQISPGQSATVKGGGQGTLVLANDMSGGGVTVALPAGANGSGTGTVTGDGYNFSFEGMSTVDGTPFNDVFLPGTGNVALDGKGGTDWLDYANAPTAAYINLSTAQYTIPSGTNAGTVVPAGTALGGFGGLTCGLPTSTGCITVNAISNVVDTARGNDVVVGGPGTGRMLGGTNGNDTFVPTGGDYVVNGGTGANNTIDLSLLPGQTTLDLWSSSRQVLGPQAGSLTLALGTIETAIASPGGSTLEAGNGNNVTLYGGPGNDTLVAATGSQTLNACGPAGGASCGGNDVLVAGIGNDNLNGGSQPVTFIPGSGGTDTVQIPVTGNTLSYGNVPVSTPWKRPPLIGPVGALINISNELRRVPTGEPFAGTSLPANQASGGWGATVRLLPVLPLPAGTNIIGTVQGSPAPDILVTGSGSTVSGGGGSDLFVVNGGGNTLTAADGSASRFLFVASGNNEIHGGGSGTVDFSQATGSLEVDLLAPPGQPGRASGGFGTSVQTLFGILNATGSSQGNNVLEVPASGGSTLIGGSGFNTFCAQAGCGDIPSNQVVGGGNTLIGGGGTNRFCAQNGRVDSINGGTGGPLSSAVVDTFDQVVNIPAENISTSPGPCN
jgi:hypothetical protein